MLFGRVYPISVFLLIHLRWWYERIPVKANPILGIPHLYPPSPMWGLFTALLQFFHFKASGMVLLTYQNAAAPYRLVTAMRWSSLDEITLRLLLPCSIFFDNTAFTETVPVKNVFYCFEDHYIKYQSNQYQNFLAQLVTRKTAIPKFH